MKKNGRSKRRSKKTDVSRKKKKLRQTRRGRSMTKTNGEQTRVKEKEDDGSR